MDMWERQQTALMMPPKLQNLGMSASWDQDIVGAQEPIGLKWPQTNNKKLYYTVATEILKTAGSHYQKLFTLCIHKLICGLSRAIGNQQLPAFFIRHEL
jgi:hypothetical protein